MANGAFPIKRALTFSKASQDIEVDCQALTLMYDYFTTSFFSSLI